MKLIHLVYTCLVLLLITFSAVSVYADPDATPASFNTLYQFTNESSIYSYFDSNFKCSIGFTIKRSILDQSVISFNLLQKKPSDYVQYLVDKSMNLFGVYEMEMSRVPFNTSVSYRFKCSYGIMNTAPSTTKVLKLVNSSFSDSESKTITSIEFELSESTIDTSYSITIGFAGIISSSKAELNLPISFYSPFQFDYLLSNNNHESIRITFPLVSSTFYAYSLNVNKFQYSSPKHDELNYVTLHTFKLYTTGSPNREDGIFQYLFDSETKFTDQYGSPINVSPKSFNCLCSKGTIQFFLLPSSVSSTTLTCSSIDVCSFISVVANSTLPSPHVDTLQSGVPVSTGPIRTSIYYKIEIPPKHRLKLDEIKIEQPQYNSAYVRISDPESSQQDAIVYVSEHTANVSLSFNNTATKPKQVFVSIEPTLIQTGVSFVPYLEKLHIISDDSSIVEGILIACGILLLTLIVISVIVAIVIGVIRKRRSQSLENFELLQN